MQHCQNIFRSGPQAIAYSLRELVSTEVVSIQEILLLERCVPVRVAKLSYTGITQTPNSTYIWDSICIFSGSENPGI